MTDDLRRDLLVRFAKLIEVDYATEGFWEDVESELGREATPQERRELRAFVDLEADRLRRRAGTR